MINSAAVYNVHQSSSLTGYMSNSLHAWDKHQLDLSYGQTRLNFTDGLCCCPELCEMIAGVMCQDWQKREPKRDAQPVSAQVSPASPQTSPQRLTPQDSLGRDLSSDAGVPMLRICGSTCASICGYLGAQKGPTLTSFRSGGNVSYTFKVVNCITAVDEVFFRRAEIACLVLSLSVVDIS